MELHEDGKGLVTLLRGVQRLQPEMTVGEAGLKHRDKLTLLWSKKYYEQATLRGMNWGKRSEFRDLAGSVYVKIPDNVDRIEESAFEKNRNLVEVLMHSGVTEIGNWKTCLSRLRALDAGGAPQLAHQHRRQSVSWLQHPDASCNARLHHQHWT